MGVPPKQHDPRVGMKVPVLARIYRDMLRAVQNDLFDLGGEVCIPGRAALTKDHVTRLDKRLEGLREKLPPLKDFVLPGGTRAAAACHLARAICRRAERSLVALDHAEPVSAIALQYVNRLSDLLFLAARTLNREAGGKETIWTPGGKAG